MALFAFGFLRPEKTAPWQWGLVLAPDRRRFPRRRFRVGLGSQCVPARFSGLFFIPGFQRQPGPARPLEDRLGVIAAQLLVFFRFDGLLPGSVHFHLRPVVRVVPMIAGLRYLFRGVFVLLPLFIALVAIGVAAAFATIRPSPPALDPALSACWSCAWARLLENRRRRLPLDPPHAVIEKERDRVLIEFPFWGAGRIHPSTRFIPSNARVITTIWSTAGSPSAPTPFSTCSGTRRPPSPAGNQRHARSRECLLAAQKFARGLHDLSLGPDAEARSRADLRRSRR